MAAARIQRWPIILSAYDFKLCYQSGNQNNNADCISRLHFDKEFKEKHSVVDNHIFMTELIHAPVTVKEAASYTNRDLKLLKVISYINHGWPNKIEEQFKPYFIRRSELSVDNSCVLWGGRVIIPMQLRTKVLEELHDNHSGIVKMKYIARSYVWWPSMDKDIENISKSCTSCQIHQNMPSKAPMHPWENSQKPWMRIHLDFAGPYLGKMFLIISDSYSKWLDVMPMNNINTTSLIQGLRQSFSTHGIPYIIVTDNGPSFISNEFKVFNERNGIKHIFTAYYHPSSNGMTERSVQILKNAIKKVIEGKRSMNLNTAIHRFLLYCRSTPHTTT